MDLENIKKPPQKVAYSWHLGIVFLCSPECPKQPRTSFPFYKFFYSTVSSRISGYMCLPGILIFLSIFCHTVQLFFSKGTNHRLYTRWLDRRIYKTEMKFWAVLGRRGCREKNLPTAISMQLFGVVFSNFCRQKETFKMFLKIF